jgi:hypothetical protein
MKVNWQMEADRANRLYAASERRVIQLEAALKRIAEGELASVVRQQADRIEQLEAALLTILANTEEDAISHTAYDGLTAYQALAKDIADCARAALDRSCQPKATT